MMSMMLSMSMSINIMVVYMKHPMSLGLMLIMQTILMAMISGKILKSFWLSYMLIITMLSGMLVLFMYMSSVASNEKFKFSFKVLMLFMLSMTVIMILSQMENMVIKNNYIGMEFYSSKMLEMNNIVKMFNNHMVITIMMVMYLFFTMMVSTYMVSITEGPLRANK